MLKERFFHNNNRPAVQLYLFGSLKTEKPKKIELLHKPDVFFYCLHKMGPAYLYKYIYWDHFTVNTKYELLH